MQNRLKTRDSGQTLESNNNWNNTKQIILVSAEENVGKVKQKKNKKPWITRDMIHKMAERRKWKNDKSENGKWQYRKINNEQRRITDQAKETGLTVNAEKLKNLLIEVTVKQHTKL